MRKRVDDQHRREFTRRLKLAIDFSGLSQNEVARRIEHSGQMLSDKKGQFPGGEAMVRLPGALGVSAEWLLQGKGSMVPSDARRDVAFSMGGQAALVELRLLLEELTARWASEGGPTPAPNDEASTAARAVAAAAARRKAGGPGGSAGQRFRDAAVGAAEARALTLTIA